MRVRLATSNLALVARHRADLAVLGFALALALAASGCSKESMLRSALEDPDERRETMTLTLQIFDEHPEYVTELFAQARNHPATFERLVTETATALEDPTFAATVASKLAAHPKAVESMTRAMMVEARDKPELRRSMANAILSEGGVMQQIAAENPELVRQVLARILTGGVPPR